MKALIVDDDGSFTGLLGLVLPPTMVESISVAHSAPEALKLVEQGPAPDVLLCDLNLPQMDGIQFMTHLAALQYAGGFIIVSGEDLTVIWASEQFARARGLNVLGALQKPFELATLEAMLASATGPVPEPVQAAEAPSPEVVRLALAAGHVAPWLQPQIDLATGTVYGIEAFACLELPGVPHVPAMDVMPLAAEHGMTAALLDVFIPSAFELAQRWRTAGRKLQLSLNLSVTSLQHNDLPDRLESCARQAGLATPAVTIAIDEVFALRHRAAAQELLARLRLKGFGTSLDDFGGGLATLERLYHLPVSELKIARRFVHGAADNDRSRGIIESCLALARRFDISAVADGAEREEDLRMLMAAGCKRVQSDHYSRALSAGQFETWLDAHHTPARQLP